MELDKEGDHDASLAQFSELTRDAPPYVPAFFMAAQQLARLGRSRTKPAPISATASKRPAPRTTPTPPAR